MFYFIMRHPGIVVLCKLSASIGAATGGVIGHPNILDVGVGHPDFLTAPYSIGL